MGMDNFTLLPGEDVEKMTFPPLSCDGTSEFPLDLFSSSHFSSLDLILIGFRSRGNKPSYWLGCWFARPPSRCFSALESEGSDGPAINPEWDKSNNFILNMLACYLSGDASHSQGRIKLKALPKQMLTTFWCSFLQICLMRNWFSLLLSLSRSLLPFFPLMDEAGCPSGRVTAGGSAPEEQQSDREVELLTPRTGSKKQLTGRNDSQTRPFRRTWWRLHGGLPLSQPHQAAWPEQIDPSDANGLKPNVVEKDGAQSSGSEWNSRQRGGKHASEWEWSEESNTSGPLLLSSAAWTQGIWIKHGGGLKQHGCQPNGRFGISKQNIYSWSAQWIQNIV